MEVVEMTTTPFSGISDSDPKRVDPFLCCVAEELAIRWTEQQQELRDHCPNDRQDLPA
jgi:hypothetical protein